MSVSVRPWTLLAIVPAVALTAAVIAVAPMPQAPAPSLPVVHVQDVALAGVGQDIYNSITPAVQYVVGGGSYLVNFIPIIGGPIAAQININYFQLIQPTVAATVNYLAGVVQDPVNIVPTTQAYGITLYDIGYNYVSAQLRFLGLQPPAPLPPIAASRVVPGSGKAAAQAQAPAPVRAPRAAASTQTAAPAAVAKKPHRATSANSAAHAAATRH